MKKSREKFNFFEFFSRVDMIRRFYNLRQQEMSKRLGISAPFYSEILRGKVGPSASLVLSIPVEFPDVSLKWLFLGEGEMFDTSPAFVVRDAGESYQLDKTDLLKKLTAFSPQHLSNLLRLLEIMEKICSKNDD